MSKYCEACFAASTHTIDLVQQAYESNYLPQRNPFVLYFLFAASLIVLSNEFGSVYANPSYELLINNSITIMQYCAKSDPQANRLLYILNSFKAAVAHVREQDMDTPALPGPAPLASGVDPMQRISKKFVRLAGVGSYFCEQSNGGTTGAACDEDGKHPAPLIRNCGCIAGE
ncbi:hypothetical protein ACHAPH_005058 [Verticillium nonalfalfae]